MIIIHRLCEINNVPGSLSSNTNRWEQKSKQELLRVCWLSLQKNINQDDFIYVLCDSVSDNTKDWIENNSTTKNIFIMDIDPLNSYKHPYPQYHYGRVNQCIQFFECVIKIAKKHNNELIFICEDDYLFLDNTRMYIDTLYFNNYENFYVPYDYPDRYFLDKTRDCKLINIQGLHYRTVPSSTLTMIMPAKLLLGREIDFMRASVFAEDNLTWKLYNMYDCYCPIPGTSTHLQNNCLTPGIDWKKEYEAICSTLST